VSSTWSGRWVAERLGVSLRTTSSPVGAELSDLVGLALRRNPRRAHLLVSTVLGKHVPTDPRLVLGAGLLLGELVRLRLQGVEPNELDRPATVRVASGHLAAALDDTTSDGAQRLVALQRSPVPPSDVVVVGYAETATALGDAVAERLGAGVYLHSTRRAVPGLEPFGGFEEAHSHATSHLLLPAVPGLLERGGALVLVDDELSTGATALSTIEALHRRAPRDRYLVAAIVDLRSDDDRERFVDALTGLGARIVVVALATGRVTLPSDVLEGGGALVDTLDRPAGRQPPETPPSALAVDLGWPRAVPETARHGVTPAHREQLAAGLPGLARTLAHAVLDSLPDDVPGAPSLLVLGTEELMAAPVQLAVALQDELSVRGRACTVRFSTTTRSPVLPLDDDGYAVRSRLTFDAHDDPDDGPGTRFAYNLVARGDERPFDVVVLVTDERGDTPQLRRQGGLLDELGAVAGRLLLVVLPCAPPAVSLPPPPDGPRHVAAQHLSQTLRLPEPLRGPRFGSYAPDEVAWLLTDLSDVPLEAPVEEREEAVQRGGAHYAESLPVEYQPTPEYRRLFDVALHQSSARVAAAVGVVTELVLAERGPHVVLASLARAGTPIGILMRRWAQQRRGLMLPHYAISIVRGRGIDATALRYLAAHHDPGSVVFVDGWTGKGAIARELAAALADHERLAGQRFDPDLAVLADPGHCVRTFGTRDDFLVPSACLNSTVSGLVSRTVLNDSLIGPDDFHGAKFYAALASDDVSAAFLDAVTARFDDVAVEVAGSWPDVAASDRTVTWAGWRAVDRISDAYGIGDVNLVKPGVGETTRVLLRRVPWRVLVRREGGHDSARDPDLQHVLLLAQQRGVPVELVDDLPYRCVGLIHPRYTRGATGSSGTAPDVHVHTKVPSGGAPDVHVHTKVPPGGPRPLVALDLDGTLLYSARSLLLPDDDLRAPRLVVSEVWRGAPLTYCTRDAEALLVELARHATVVPVTTRTLAQLARVRLFDGSGPSSGLGLHRYAVAANGAHLLVEGRPDEAWAARVRAGLASWRPLTEVTDALRRATEGHRAGEIRLADELFAYVAVDLTTLPGDTVPVLSAWCEAGGWRVSLQGRRLYCVPRALSKAAAVAEVQRRTGATSLLAAGDSLLDADLLESADVALRPAHGELHEAGWLRPHLTVTGSTGVLAGEEIVRRLLDHAASTGISSSPHCSDEIVSDTTGSEGERTYV
jgi:adenine/guanine phosphoribosyltransferase-like PRPP-binding protein